jgi:hypothetical protein
MQQAPFPPIPVTAKAPATAPATTQFAMPPSARVATPAPAPFPMPTTISSSSGSGSAASVPLPTQTVPPVPRTTASETPSKDWRARIMVGTPAYGGQCFVGYSLSLINSIKHCMTRGIDIEPCHLTNESLIPRGRNTIVAKFLADPTLTHLLFIDADITWAKGTIERLLNHNQDVIGALYPKKGYDWQNLVKNPEAFAILQRATEEKRKLTDQEIGQIRAKLMSYTVNLSEDKAIRRGLLSVKHLGTGFMLIQRHVLEKMCDAFPQLKYDDDINILTPEQNKHLYAFFDCEIRQLNPKRHYLSEDYLFCARWIDLGGKIYSDITIPLTHTGTHSFAGSFATGVNFKTRAASTPSITSSMVGSGSTTSVTPSSGVTDPKMTVQRTPAITTATPPPAPAPISNLQQAGRVAPAPAVVTTPQSGSTTTAPPVSSASSVHHPLPPGQIQIA